MNALIHSTTLLQLTLLCLSSSLIACHALAMTSLQMNSRSLPAQIEKMTANKSEGTRWALLVAGSSGWYNYRHQADVCHAYQLLKKGGLKDENIVVFMYDDIASDINNPREGEIINSPAGSDVYKGVPKDYVGGAVTAKNFYAAILGDKNATVGGSGKVIASGPNDDVFIYYADHGAAGVLGMPNLPYVYADNLVEVLKLKHKQKGYKNLVFYLEACESGSIFDGVLPEGLNIFATTAANSSESSWATYCPQDVDNPAPGAFDTCLGDLYSVAWIEDAEVEDREKETLQEEYELVKNRTKNNKNIPGSHVLEFGDLLKLGKDHLSEFMGIGGKFGKQHLNLSLKQRSGNNRLIGQRDADLLHFWHKFISAQDGSEKRLRAQEELMEILSHRVHIDKSIERIGKLLNFESTTTSGRQLMNGAVRPAGQPVVDDWQCLKEMVRTFETHCGSLSQYGMKHMRSLANMCNYKISKKQMGQAARQACPSRPTNRWSSLNGGFSA